MLQTQNVDAVIAYRVWFKETKHFDFVCEGVAQGIKDLNVQTDIPVIFCSYWQYDATINRSVEEFMAIKGTAIAAIKMALFANRLLWHIKKNQNCAHWSFADRQRLPLELKE
jgi:6,7-dimethyl-8-ribityllumazine synthase